MSKYHLKTVEFAVNGEEAISQYQAAMKDGRAFDIIIMDLTIPGGMGGKSAVRSVLNINPDAKVIVSSGYSNDPVMSNYRGYGFCGIGYKTLQTGGAS